MAMRRGEGREERGEKDDLMMPVKLVLEIPTLALRGGNSPRS
jgi:hypothetical protein